MTMASSFLVQDALRRCSAAQPAVANEQECARLLAALWTIAEAGVGVVDPATGRIAVPIITPVGVISMAAAGAADLDETLATLALATEDLVSKGFIRLIGPCSDARTSSWYELLPPARRRSDGSHSRQIH